MTMRFRCILGLLFALSTSVPSASAQFAVANSERGAAAFVWSQELSGSIGGTTGGTAGSGSLTGDSDSSFGVAGNFGRWEFGFVSMENESTGTVQSTFTFDGATYTAGSTFQVSQDIAMVDLFRRFTLGSAMGNANVHALFGLKFLDMDVDARSLTGPPAQGNVDGSIPLPMLGLAARFGPKSGIQGFASAKFFKLAISDVDASVTDLNLGVAYRIPGGFHAALGWRKFELDADFDEGKATSGSVDLENDGLYFEVGLKF